jgi:hypothetical protein
MSRRLTAAQQVLADDALRFVQPTIAVFVRRNPDLRASIRRVDMDGANDALVYALTGDFNGAAYESVNDGVFVLEDSTIFHVCEDGADVLTICAVTGVTPHGLTFNPYVSTFYCGDGAIAEVLYEVDMTGAATLFYNLPSVDVRGFMGIVCDSEQGNIYIPGLSGPNDKIYKVPTYTLREIVYYNKILEDGSLNVTQRALFTSGDGEVAGATNDTVRPFTPFWIKYQVPSAGLLSEPASEVNVFSALGNTLHYYNEGRGMWMGNLQPEEMIGLWINKMVARHPTIGLAVSDIAGAARIELNLRIGFKVGGVQHTRNLFGCFRIEHDATAGYFLYEGLDGAEPTFGTESAVSTASALPFDFVPTLQPGGMEYRYVCRYRNAYGLMSQNIWSKRFKLDEFGAVISLAPTPPLRADVRETVGGLLNVFVEYSGREDEEPADKVRVYWRNDTTAASDTDDYVEADLTANSLGTLRPGLSSAVVEIGPFPKNTDVRIFCVTRRDADGMNSLTGVSLSAEIGSAYVISVKPKLTLGAQPQHLDPGYFAEVTQELHTDGFNTFNYIMKSGVSILEAEGAGELFRLRHDSADPFDRFANSFQTAFSIRTLSMPDQVPYQSPQADIPVHLDIGGGIFSAVQVQFSANGYTRLTIDSDGGLDGVMRMSAFRHWTTQVIPDITPDGTGIQEVGYYLMFPVWDRATRRFVNVMALGPDGVLYSKIPYVQIVAGSGNYK